MHDVNNIMVILSSPSGAGKTTITKKIQQKYQTFKISVSHTTRLPRSNEVDGVDYHFVSHKDFEALINQDKFYEHAKIFDNYYGTSKNSVNVLLTILCKSLSVRFTTLPFFLILIILFFIYFYYPFIINITIL